MYILPECNEVGNRLKKQMVFWSFEGQALDKRLISSLCQNYSSLNDYNIFEMNIRIQGK